MILRLYSTVAGVIPHDVLITYYHLVILLKVDSKLLFGCGCKPNSKENNGTNMKNTGVIILFHITIKFD